MSKGLSMVELALIFTVMAVAIAGVSYAYHSVMISYKYQELVKIVQQGIAGIYEFNAETSGKMATPDMNTLYNQGYLTMKPSSHTNVYHNPLGGDVVFQYTWREPIFTNPTYGYSIIVSFLGPRSEARDAECNRAYAILSHMVDGWAFLNACNPPVGQGVPAIELENTDTPYYRAHHQSSQSI